MEYMLRRALALVLNELQSGFFLFKTSFFCLCQTSKTLW